MAEVRSGSDLSRIMDRGEARAVLVIPTGLARDVEAGHVVPVQLLLNGDNANTATTVMGYALTILQSGIILIYLLG